MTRVILDPVTRVGGQLHLEADVDGSAVSEAWLSATAFRGLEHNILTRDARDAWLFAQRICGTAAGIHALASVRAVENSLGVRVPPNARLLRNMLTGVTYVQSHVTHFYLHEVPDWADAQSALSADPTATSNLAHSMSDWPRSDAAYFKTAQDRVRVLVTSGPLANGRWGHPAYRSTPELSLLLYAHYLDSIDWARKLVTVRTVLGGKSPHPQTYLVGGMAVAPEWGGPARATDGEHPWRAARHSAPPLSENAIAQIGQLMSDATAFVDNVVVPDAEAVAVNYQDWEGVGRGIGHYLSAGEFPLDDGWPGSLVLPSGRVMDRDLSRDYQVYEAGFLETVAHSWYHSSEGDGALVGPTATQTTPAYSGPQPPYETLAGLDKYSWSKAPRYLDDPIEVGPLARLLVGYAGGAPEASAAVNDIIGRLSTGRDGLFSVLGRTLARAAEAQLVGHRLDGWLRELVANLGSGDFALTNLDGTDVARWPSDASSCGMVEGPQGAVGHWVSVAGRRIADYQVIDGNTWNLSPRDQRGRPGAIEQALAGTPVADPANPLEIERALHSFDPCAACAVH
jgi:Ni,Fe-hydrogenase I large subunit